METTLQELFSATFRTAPAREANAAIGEVREEQAQGERLARVYELVVPADATLAWFAQSVLPKLVYHLESLGAHLPQCQGVVIAAFRGEELLFVHARDLVAAASRLLGLEADELVRQHGTGESRTAVAAAPPLALPPPRGEN